MESVFDLSDTRFISESLILESIGKSWFPLNPGKLFSVKNGIGGTKVSSGKFGSNPDTLTGKFPPCWPGIGRGNSIRCKYPGKSPRRGPASDGPVGTGSIIKPVVGLLIDGCFGLHGMSVQLAWKQLLKYL